MDNNLNNTDFEQFVKQNADQYRMFPSEKVWKNIHNSLHTRRRWYGLGLIVLLLTAGIVTWVMLTPSIGNLESLSYNPSTVSQSTTSEQKINSTPILITAEKPTGKKSNYITTTESLQKKIIISATENDYKSDDEFEKNIFTSVLPKNDDEKVAITTPAAQNNLPVKNLVAHNKTNLPVKTEINHVYTKPISITPLVSETKPEELITADKKTEPNKEDAELQNIENIVSSGKKHRSGKKMSWEVFITPTISYRNLNENKDFINTAQANNNIFNYTSLADINSLVTHRPDMGLQVGFSAGYPITKSLKIIGGLQFNVSKYDIKASFSTGEVATIALNTGSGSNSVSTISNYRNFNDSKADWLRNFYFSASIPVGFELNLSGNKKNEFGITGTFQPTYVLSDRAYLLSTDYKNYVEVPSLIRRLNMNTSFGFYAGFSTGKLNWRIGPQARYQLKSSFKSKYPVNEHLFDFGVKAGIMLNK